MASSSMYMADPPEGVRRFEGDSIQANMAACAIVTALIALAVVGLRLYTRIFLTAARFQMDDVFVCCAAVCSIMLIPVSFKIMEAGVGLHMWNVTMSQYNPGLGIWTLIATIFYAWAVIFSKLSILAFYLRLSPQPWFRILTFSLMAIASAYVLVYTFLFVFRCHPLALNWDVTITHGSCIDTRTIMTVLSVANIVMDVLTLLLPVPVIMRLNMRLAQRVSVIILFSSGIFVCAIAIQRTLQMLDALTSPDYTWDITEQFYWSYVEVNMGILCASVPALKPFAKRHLATMFGSSGRYHRGGEAGGESGPPGAQGSDAIMLAVTPKRSSYTRF
ncbi:hypothetical protein P170DRAFT_448802 [Aspergillus steynii IBT 23096]|uniref:Rhodopsin domain-containing protein n=1 Tax=Aspergillus steynii IBT 23096 TaxID=1392250 RepID=A0A2I2G2M8_9EURO|nr:uncharacterized protein P170DRAFT_448802 [Aspergillus steynii IBT 23096]PLB47125.1 hypothetical protein P170DRAFT_448802 [Aspergillus steynii IBT 23096]